MTASVSLGADVATACIDRAEIPFVGEQTVTKALQTACRREGIFRGGMPRSVHKFIGGKNRVTSQEPYHTPSLGQAGQRRGPRVQAESVSEFGPRHLRPCTVEDLISRRRKYRSKCTPIAKNQHVELRVLNVQGLNPYRADNRIKLAALITQAREHAWDIALLSDLHGTYDPPKKPTPPQPPPGLSIVSRSLTGEMAGPPPSIQRSLPYRGRCREREKD